MLIPLLINADGTGSISNKIYPPEIVKTFKKKVKIGCGYVDLIGTHDTVYGINSIGNADFSFQSQNGLLYYEVEIFNPELLESMEPFLDEIKLGPTGFASTRIEDGKVFIEYDYVLLGFDIIRKDYQRLLLEGNAINNSEYRNEV